MRLMDNRLTACIAVAAETEKIYMYSSRGAITLVATALDEERIWDGYAEFLETLEAHEMAMLSVNLGIRLDFKKGLKEDLATELWSELCSRADDRRTAVAAVEKRRGRKKQDLGSRRYVVIFDDKMTREEAIQFCPCSTRQAKRIWTFFVDEVLKTGLWSVTEARMQNIVNDRAEELNTKQDPWRIFQYYRPELIDCQLIKIQK